MIDNDVRGMISEGYPEAILYDNPSFDKSIIGVSDDDRVVYSYSKMVKEMMEDDPISEEEAEDFINYNTLRANSYVLNPPIVVFDVL